MIVYGDHAIVVNTAGEVEALMRASPLSSGAGGLAWHQGCCELFLRLAGLLQGWADREAEAQGFDNGSAAQAILMQVLIGIAEALDRSWSTGFAVQTTPDLSALESLIEAAPSPTLSVRLCEGFAHYAVYPELYLAAARKLPAGSIVIGLRSIGAGLAALVAAASKARLAVTVRPQGSPFSRHVQIGPNLEAEIVSKSDASIVLVDEGPGLSGSSFGGTADWLEARGVDAMRIVFMPSHDQALGSEASAAHSRRWAARPRLLASFEDVLVGPKAVAPLATWFDDLTGLAEKPLQDLSGGTWRSFSPYPLAAADPQREARKYLLTAAKGFFLLKFIGLGLSAHEKFDRARVLHRAGFGLEPLALRHGFLLERWCGDARKAELQAVKAALGDYLAFRAQAFGSTQAGSSLPALVAMAARNLSEAIGDDAALLFAAWPEQELRALQVRVRPVHFDGRLHLWEWLQTGDGLKKADAVDHSQAHDLVGCQDIAWDVAGAIVEYDLGADEADRLIDRVMPGRPDAASLVRCLTLCYLGFQLGWWSMAVKDEVNDAHQERYRSKARALMTDRLIRRRAE